jgi:PASTA domain
MVIPRLVGLDVANAVAEAQYLRMIAAVVDRDHRPMLGGTRDHTVCRVTGQDPRPGTEVVVNELTITVTITARCAAAARRSGDGVG